MEHFKVAYDNKAFTLSHCWIVVKDSKKWEDNFALWQDLEKKKGKGNGNASTGDAIDLDAQKPCLGNPEGQGLSVIGKKR
jgi:hypothetical protein